MGVAERLAERGPRDPACPGRSRGRAADLPPSRPLGDVAYIAGDGPTHGDGWGSPLGQVGREVTVEQAIAGAELTALNVLGTIERELGTLDGIACWLKINGYVNAVDGFTEQARVINGFSDLILDLYGEERLAARTSIGVPHLPFGMPVEVDAIIALS